MSKPTLILTVGLPRSGKSSYVRSSGIPVCCPDEVRKVLGCFPFTAAMEPLVWSHVHVMIECLFASGAQKVVLDATNVTIRRREDWKSDKWDREFWVFPTSKEVCIERAKVGGQDYLIPIIERMARDFEMPKVYTAIQTY